MPEEAGSQALAGCLSTEAGAAHHKIPAPAKGNDTLLLLHFHSHTLYTPSLSLGKICEKCVWFKVTTTDAKIGISVEGNSEY